jgi:hypothetical protein
VEAARWWAMWARRSRRRTGPITKAFAKFFSLCMERVSAVIKPMTILYRSWEGISFKNGFNLKSFYYQGLVLSTKILRSEKFSEKVIKF